MRHTLPGLHTAYNLEPSQVFALSPSQPCDVGYEDSGRWDGMARKGTQGLICRFCEIVC